MAKRIETIGLSCFYAGVKAVDDVSITIEPKSVTALIGPTGCGKSTFLRALNRMHEVVPRATDRRQGPARRRGHLRPGHRRAAVRRTIGMVFQKPNPFPTMSIYDNVAAGLKLNGLRKKSDLDTAVERSLRGANLWDEVKDRLSKPGMGLSGGQQQRLCIARAIAVEPQVLLMDEPCSALDPISTLAIEDLITELKDRYTIVIVTHNMQQAARVSDVTAFFTVEGPGRARRADRGRHHPADLHQPGREAHRGLHHWAFRLSVGLAIAVTRPRVAYRGRLPGLTKQLTTASKHETGHASFDTQNRWRRTLEGWPPATNRSSSRPRRSVRARNVGRGSGAT